MGRKPGGEAGKTPTLWPEGLVQAQADGCLLRVKVVPKARKLGLVGVVGDALKVSLTAAAEKGEANRQLEDFLAEALDLPRKRVVLRAGLTSRTKLVFLAGVDRDWLLQRLRTVLS